MNTKQSIESKLIYRHINYKCNVLTHSRCEHELDEQPMTGINCQCCGRLSALNTYCADCSSN